MRIEEARGEIDRILTDDGQSPTKSKLVRRSDILRRLQDLRWHRFEEFETGDFEGRYGAAKDLSPRDNLRKRGLQSIANRLDNVGSTLRLDIDDDHGRVRLAWTSPSPASRPVLSHPKRPAAGLWHDHADPAAAASVIEGLVTESKRYIRGRSRRLRELAMQKAKGVCAACEVNFARLLNGAGKRVLQVHHRQQLSSTDEPRLTRVEELAVVCANCHMLIHIDPRSPMAVEELRLLLKSASL